MRDKRSLHLEVQEHIDCFAGTDPLKEMSEITGDTDKEQAALKWLALTVLHGINFDAKKISLSKAADGTVTVVAEYRNTELPSPGAEIGQNVIDAVRQITHFEGDKGMGPLALGVRDDSLEIGVHVERGEDGETITLKFPESK
ncbi:MAG: hypothetical protein JSU72_08965 [Deltaproteobacteria bacterium]|nr:MAG: hypothetical protein JSU72_08965 [Deltaproteobacteria bacterium]